MKRDRLYASPRKERAPFAFTAEVAEVFDDMVERSIPDYCRLIRQEAEMAAGFYRQGTRIYDLGCSTGNLESGLLSVMGPRPFTVVAVDDAFPMLRLLSRKIRGFPGAGQVLPVCIDLRAIRLAEASVVAANFTLQFIPPPHRDRLVVAICNALVPGGVFLLAEKVTHPDPVLQRLQQERYHRFKKENGYSELEISQKRDALENVLVPETVERHQQRLQAAGFTTIELWYKWFNFAAWICRREA